MQSHAVIIRVLLYALLVKRTDRQTKTDRISPTVIQHIQPYA
eukprot:COSAG06_NODE_55107_length_291_cov_0.796875_1_plen_41_part_10